MALMRVKYFVEAPTPHWDTTKPAPCVFLRAVKRNQRSMFLRVSLGSPSFQPNFEVKKNLHSIYIVVSGFL